MSFKRTLRVCSAPAFALGILGMSRVAQSFSPHRVNEHTCRPTNARQHAPRVLLHATSDYLSSLSSPPESLIEAQQQSPEAGHSQGDAIIPDDHYSKEHPNAGWRGYANPQWGGYLDSLPSNCLQEGKKSDYGDDVRWGAEVYLNSVGNG